MNLQWVLLLTLSVTLAGKKSKNDYNGNNFYEIAL